MEGIVNHAEQLFAEKIQEVSARVGSVGPDTMSILISSPSMPEHVVRIRYQGASGGRVMQIGRVLPMPGSEILYPLGGCSWVNSVHVCF